MLDRRAQLHLAAARRQRPDARTEVRDRRTANRRRGHRRQPCRQQTHRGTNCGSDTEPSINLHAGHPRLNQLRAHSLRLLNASTARASTNRTPQKAAAAGWSPMRRALSRSPSRVRRIPSTCPRNDGLKAPDRCIEEQPADQQDHPSSATRLCSEPSHVAADVLPSLHNPQHSPSDHTGRPAKVTHGSRLPHMTHTVGSICIRIGRCD